MGVFGFHKKRSDVRHPSLLEVPINSKVFLHSYGYNLSVRLHTLIFLSDSMSKKEKAKRNSTDSNNS